METLTLASFDIGLKNFAQYVERCNVEHILSLRKRYHSLPKKLQRRVKGQMNNDIKSILDGLPDKVEILEMNTYDLRISEEKDAPYDIESRKAIFNHLEKFRHLWNQCDVFIIERQYFGTFTPKGRKTKGTEANIKAIKIEEVVISWFMINYPIREVEEFGSQFKTHMLGAPYNLTKPQRKKWTVDQTLMEFEKLGKTKELEHLRSTKKRKQKIDDMCDAKKMCDAWKFKTLVGEF